MLLFPVPPCTAGQSLLGRALCGSFLVPSARWRLVRASLSPLCSSSKLRGLCALVSASQALPLQCGAGVHLTWLPRPARCFSGFVFSYLGSQYLTPTSQGLCALVLSHRPDLCRGLCVLSAPEGHPLCCEGCAYCLFGCFPSLSTQGWTLHREGCVPSRGLHAMPHSGPSVPQGLPALERFVCLPTLGSLSPLSGWGHSL